MGTSRKRSEFSLNPHLPGEHPPPVSSQLLQCDRFTYQQLYSYCITISTLLITHHSLPLTTHCSPPILISCFHKNTQYLTFSLEQESSSAFLLLHHTKLQPQSLAAVCHNSCSLAWLQLQTLLPLSPQLLLPLAQQYLFIMYHLIKKTLALWCFFISASPPLRLHLHTCRLLLLLSHITIIILIANSNRHSHLFLHLAGPRIIHSSLLAVIIP